MAVAIGTVTTASIIGATTVTTSFTSTAQPLYVIYPIWLEVGCSITGVTYGATPVALTRVAQSALSSARDSVEIWRLLAPVAGTANLVTTFAGGGTAKNNAVLAVFNTTGQDTGTPEGTAATNAGSGTATATGSLSVAGAATGDLTIVGIALGAQNPITPAATGGSALTEFMDTNTGGGEESEAFRVSDAATAVSGSWTGATSWAIAAIPLKAPVAVLPPKGRVYLQAVNRAASW